MFKVFIVLASIFTFYSSNAQKTIIHDPNAKVISVESFSAISVSGGIDIFLSQGNEVAVAVSANEIAFRDRIKTAVENGVLKIWYDGKGISSYTGNKKLKAYIAFTNIVKLTASGACDIYIDGLMKGDELAIHLTGASDFKGNVQFNTLSLHQTGASDVTISGKATTLNIDAVGASTVKGYELEAENCSIRATGASDIRITVQKELVASATGASSIHYKGNGVIKEVRSTGASSINKKS